MSSPYRSWPGPARTLAEAVDAGVSAAHAADAPAFASARIELARIDHEQLLMVLGTLTRDLIERSLPDGLDSEGASAILTRCVASSGWYDAFDIDALVRALTDLLGVGDPDGQPDVTPDAVLAHGIVLIADLVTAAHTTLQPVLDAALQELRRAQTIELP